MIRNYTYTYQEALFLWEKIQPLKTRTESAPRPLEGIRRGTNPRTVQLKSDGAVVFRLYSTDVAVWYPDRLVVTPYCSKTTNDFANVYAGPILPYWSYRRGDLNALTGENSTRRIFLTPSTFTVRDGLIVDGTVPITVPTLQKKGRTKILKESRYTEFVAWYKAALRLDVAPAFDGAKSWGMTTLQRVRALVQGPEDEEHGWPYLAKALDPRNATATEDTLRCLRTAVYDHYGAVVRTDIPYFNSWGEVERAIRAVSTYD